jgi:hypothetical protein
VGHGAQAQDPQAVITTAVENNMKIDEEKYQHPDDFLYEEKVEDVVEEKESLSAEEKQQQADYQQARNPNAGQQAPPQMENTTEVDPVPAPEQ